MEKELDSETVYNKHFLKSKIKSHDYKATDFYDKEMLNAESNHNFLALITIYSLLKSKCYILYRLSNFRRGLFRGQIICLNMHTKMIWRFS